MNTLSLGQFCDLLIRHKIILHDAIYEPEEYDGGRIAEGCFKGKLDSFCLN